MKVSVITPCYNSARWIRETVQNVLDQDFLDWEFILIDDGSTDDTPTILREFASIDERIRTVTQKNSGTCAARNRGASECSPDSKYLLFLDHDDLLEPNALRVLSHYLNRHPEVCLVGCQFQEIDQAGKPCSSRRRSRWVPSILGLPRPLRASERRTPFVTFYCGTGQGPFAMFRRFVFQQSTGWTTDFWPHEDTDMFCQMALLGDVHYLSDRLYRKRFHAECGFLDTKRVQEAYTSFRRKWDNYRPCSEKEGEILAEAAAFYRQSFRPLRNAKVGLKALGEFFATRDTRKLRWALPLFRDAARDTAQYRLGATVSKR